MAKAATARKGAPKRAMRLEAERLARELPNAPTRTLAKRLADEFQVTVEQARAVMRRVRGSSGAENKNKASLVIPRGASPESAKTPKTPPTQLPDSLAAPWEPLELDCKRAFVLSDVHIPYHAKSALEAALKHGESLDPDCVILNGDMADFYTISRHQKDPRKRKWKQELELNRQFSQHIRERFPKSRIIYKYGNHEERWEHYVWNHAPELADCEEMLLSQWLKLDAIGIEWIDNQRPIMLGHLPVFHGHELPKGMSSPVNQARGAFLRMLDTVLVGHGHRSSSHTEPNWMHTETTCWSTGCLCDLNPEYARINKWNWGHAWVEVSQDKSFAVHNMRINKSGVVRPA